MIHQLVKVNQVQIQAVIGDKSPKEKPGSASGDFQDPLLLQQPGASLLPREQLLLQTWNKLMVPMVSEQPQFPSSGAVCGTGAFPGPTIAVGWCDTAQQLLCCLAALPQVLSRGKITHFPPHTAPGCLDKPFCAADPCISPFRTGQAAGLALGRVVGSCWTSNGQSCALGTETPWKRQSRAGSAGFGESQPNQA